MSRKMRNTHTRPRRLSRLLPAAIAALALIGAASASAASSIEGIWSFNGGQIAIEREPGGTFKGTVVSPTKFAVCTHPDGQLIWTSVTPQPDGSYWGLHQWYEENATGPCALNPQLGLTAFRVIEEADGQRYLRVCLSEPGQPQPSIPPGSLGVGASFGCESSALTGTLASTAVGGFKEVVSLPSNRLCLSLRKFKIHIREAKLDPFKTVSVTLQGHKLRVSRHGDVLVATVNLRGLRAGAFTVRIKAVTFRGDHLAGKRTYHTCAKKAIHRKVSTTLR